MKRIFSVVLIIQVSVLQYAACDAGLLNNSRIPCNEQNVEAYLDHVLENVTSQMSNYIKLPDRDGVVKLSDGRLWGFATLKRDGSAKVVCNNKSLTITASLKADDVAGRYNWYVKAMISEFKGLIYISAKTFEAKIQVTQENDPHAYLKLDRFEITRMEGIDVEVTGLDYVTWLVSKLIDPVVESFRRSTALIVSRPIRKALARELSLIRIPLE